MSDLSTMSDDDLSRLAAQTVARRTKEIRQQLDQSRASDDDLLASLKPVQPQAAPAPPRSVGDVARDAMRDTAAGMLRGAGSIGATILTPVDAAARALGVENSFIGRRDRRESMTAALGTLGADADSLAFQAGKVTGEVAGTAGLPVAAARPLAGVVPTLSRAIASGGIQAPNLGARAVGGAAAGAVSAAAVNPDDAGLGASIGAAVPVAGRAIGRALSGPDVAPAVRSAGQAAARAGFVIPPTQVRPSFGNRMLEGISGKISTAQNASARNQEVTNDLARRAIGAAELSPAGLAAVRQRANQAYDALGAAGTFTTDVSFRRGLSQLGRRSRQLAKDFPELANQQLDDMLQAFGGTQSFSAQSGIEAIKRLRARATANAQAIGDPVRKEVSRVEHAIAEQLESLVERNLTRTKQTPLLERFREARTTLARVYDIEKGLNPVTGNVDAAVLARLLKKGRPLTGELKQIADFASAFPKATQVPERMGSLPQTSPLDWGAAAITAAATGAGPLTVAALATRPALRVAALSGPVQRRAVAGPPLGAFRAGQVIGRALPVAAADDEQALQPR
jgi:hypothetical protein